MLDEVISIREIPDDTDGRLEAMLGNDLQIFVIKPPAGTVGVYSLSAGRNWDKQQSITLCEHCISALRTYLGDRSFQTRFDESIMTDLHDTAI